MATSEAPLRELLKTLSFTQFPLHTTPAFFAPAELPRAQLHIHRPLRFAASSPTCDARCLRALALLRFADCPVDLFYDSAPEASPDGRLPFLLLPQRTALDAAAIEQHVQGGLPQSPPDHRAFLALAEHNLLPAVDYLAWVDTEGAGILLPRLLPFHPLVQWALGVQRASHMASVLRTSQPEYAATLDAHVIYDNALRALDALVVLLDDKTYFAGERPAALDALVFACVNAIVELPVPSPLRAALLREDSKYAPLVAFTMRILERYFPSTEKSDLI